MRCLIVDDEPLALETLEEDLQQIPFVQLVSKTDNALEVPDLIARYQPDLLILDIQMPFMKGTELLRMLPNRPPLVVFLTAYPNYALEGFDLDVVDYLMKPVSFTRLHKAMLKANNLLTMIHAAEQTIPASRHIFVKSDYRDVQICLDDIIYVESQKDYIKIVLQKQRKPVITQMSLKQFHTMLPAAEFLRVHRSYIIAKKQINNLHRGYLSVAGCLIPLGYSYKTQVQQVLGLMPQRAE